MIPENIRVLYLAAAAQEGAPLRSDKEQSLLREILGRNNLDPILNASLNALQRELVTRSHGIIHICTHGDQDGIRLRGDSENTLSVVPPRTLASLLNAASTARDGQLECAVLGACWSSTTGERAAMVPFTIAMSGEVDDQAAINFSCGFYTALRGGQDYVAAYEQGVIRAGANHEEAFDSELLQANTGVLGVRSFVKDAEDLELRTERVLLLDGYFNGRLLRPPTTWREIHGQIESFCVNPTLRQRMRTESFQIYLDCHLSISLALGHFFGFDAPVFPWQGRGRLRRELWTPDGTLESRKPPLRELSKQQGDGDDTELVVSIGITHPIVEHVDNYLSSIGLRAHHIALEPQAGAGRDAVSGAAHAAAMANQIGRRLHAIRAGRHERRIHLFMACPNALAFLIGQQGHMLGPLQLYEFDFSSQATSNYSPSISLPPSD